MGIRGALNLTSVLLVICNLLFMFTVWVGANWIERVQAIEPRVVRLETALDNKMEEINRRLSRIESSVQRP